MQNNKPHKTESLRLIKNKTVVHYSFKCRDPPTKQNSLGMALALIQPWLQQELCYTTYIDLLVFILLYFQNQIMLINLVICLCGLKKLFNSVIFTLKLYLFLNIFELQSVSCYIICKSWLVPKLLKLLQTWQLYDYSDHLSHHNRSGLRKMLYYKLLALQEALCLRQFELQTTF